jgi:hypothetical protein
MGMSLAIATAAAVVFLAAASATADRPSIAASSTGVASIIEVSSGQDAGVKNSLNGLNRERHEPTMTRPATRSFP